MSVFTALVVFVAGFCVRSICGRGPSTVTPYFRHPVQRECGIPHAATTGGPDIGRS